MSRCKHVSTVQFCNAVLFCVCNSGILFKGASLNFAIMQILMLLACNYDSWYHKSMLLALFSTLSACLLFQHLLLSFCFFMSCHHFSSSAIVAGQSLKYNFGTHFENEELILPPLLLLYYTRLETSIIAPPETTSSQSISMCLLATTEL